MLHKSELKPGHIYEIAHTKGGISNGVYVGKTGLINKQYIFNIDCRIQRLECKSFAIIRPYNMDND